MTNECYYYFISIHSTGYISMTQGINSMIHVLLDYSDPKLLKGWKIMYAFHSIFIP